MFIVILSYFVPVFRYFQFEILACSRFFLVHKYLGTGYYLCRGGGEGKKWGGGGEGQGCFRLARGGGGAFLNN